MRGGQGVKASLVPESSSTAGEKPANPHFYYSTVSRQV